MTKTEISRPTIVAVSGLSSNTGKTTLMCDLLERLPGWEAIKLTRGHYRSCGKDPNGCCVSDLIRDEPLVRTGRAENYETGKDTGRFWDSGAANVHWVIAGEDQVEEGIKQALSRVQSAGVVVEGNSFLDFVAADFALICARAGENRMKTSARMDLAKADAIYLSTIDDCDGVTARKRFDGWRESLTVDLDTGGLPIHTKDDIPELANRIQAFCEQLNCSRLTALSADGTFRGPGNMITIRKSEDRGHFDLGWLDTYHTFSFDQYYDPAHMHFRSLRVMNEDRVQAAKGFPTHSHRDMEIITYILSGALEHRDSMGNGSVIRPGDVQRMSAGTGVAHSEFNPSESESVHLLQIWILPESQNLPPSYEEKHFGDEERRGRLRLIASRDAREGSVKIHQDTQLFATILEAGESVVHTVKEGRSAWLQVARGTIRLNDVELKQGDGAAVRNESELTITAHDQAEFLLFDLA